MPRTIPDHLRTARSPMPSVLLSLLLAFGAGSAFAASGNAGGAAGLPGASGAVAGQAGESAGAGESVSLRVGPNADESNSGRASAGEAGHGGDGAAGQVPATGMATAAMRWRHSR
jgi:hypothetical protein